MVFRLKNNIVAVPREPLPLCHSLPELKIKICFVRPPAFLEEWLSVEMEYAEDTPEVCFL